MKTTLALLILASSLALADGPPEPKFTAITLDDKIQIGYGLAIADLDGDGRPDIAASGRATHNVKLYFNDTPR